MPHAWSFPLSLSLLAPDATGQTTAEEEAGWHDVTVAERFVRTRGGTVVHLDLRERGALERLVGVTHPVGLSLPRSTPPDRDLLAAIDAATRATSVGLSVSALDDLSFLNALPELAALDVIDGPPPPLAALPRLESLRIANVKAVIPRRGERRAVPLGEALAPLADCHRLRRLSVTQAPLAELAFLTNLPALRALRLGVVANGSELRHLGAVAELEDLELDVASLASGDLAPLGGLRNLKRLELRIRAPDTELDLGPLADATKLEHLDVRCEATFPRSPPGVVPRVLVWPALRKLASWNWQNPGPWLERLSAPRLTNLLVASGAPPSTLTWLPRFPALEALHLSGKIAPGALAHVRSLPALRALDVGFVTGLGDEALAHVAGLPLIRLDASWTGLGDAGAPDLATLTKLRELRLERTGLTDASAHLLGNLEDLEELDLSLTSVSDGTLLALAKLTKLRKLDLGRTKVTDAGLAHLGSLRRLESLWLDRADITDAGMRHLGKLTSLRFLSLRDVEAVTDTGFRELLGLANLRHLVFYSPEVTEEAERALLERLPNLSMDA